MLESGKGLPCTMQRKQFPVKVAFALTINKSQGQTFEYVGIDLMEDVFSHGQLYVAFSRAKRFSAVKVIFFLFLYNNFRFFYPKAKVPQRTLYIKNCFHKLLHSSTPLPSNAVPLGPYSKYFF